MPCQQLVDRLAVACLGCPSPLGLSVQHLHNLSYTLHFRNFAILASREPNRETIDSIASLANESNLTELLDDWVRGDRTALDRLTPLIYPQLRTLASAHLRRGNGALTMQTTAIVNELFLKLLTRRPSRVESRLHFYALAAKIIRAALVDHYREVRAEKRGGELTRVPLHEELLWIDANSDSVLDFEQAMMELEKLDRQQADLFGMRFLLGSTSEETAELSGLSKATVDRKVKLARAWLFQRITGSKSSRGPS